MQSTEYWTDSTLGKILCTCVIFGLIWLIRPRGEISHQLINENASTLLSARCLVTWILLMCCVIMYGVQYNIIFGVYQGDMGVAGLQQ